MQPVSALGSIPVSWRKQTRGKMKYKLSSVVRACGSEADFCWINSSFMNIRDELVKYRVHSVLRGTGVLEILKRK